MQEDYNQYINFGELLAAVREKHGGNAKITSYNADLATKSIQGFTSVMLRIVCKVSINNEEITSKLILKRPANVKAQLEMMEEMGVFKREIAYFNKALPILLNKNPTLPIVKVYFAHDDILIMEDLTEEGYANIGKTGQEVIQKKLMKMSYIRFAMRKLAELHVTSLDVDWNQILGEHLHKDPFVQDSNLFYTLLDTICTIIRYVMKQIAPEKSDKYDKFFVRDNIFNILQKHMKAKENTVNVLLHGDYWSNNIMYKLDPETNEPLKLKLIDLQIFKYGPAYIDILYFMHFVLSRKIRDINEKEIVKTYVEAFNSYACRTPDLLNLETFYQQFNEAKIYGLIMGALIKPTFYMDILPKEGEHFSEDNYTDFSKADLSKIHIDQYNSNEAYKQNYIEIVQELIEYLDTTN